MKWNINLILFCIAYLGVISNAQRNGDLRLTGGIRGQLEVYFNGWGFICDDGWSSVDANTTCKILGYGTAVTTTIAQYNTSTNYKLNLIDCIGNETSILDCGYRIYIGGTYCSTSEHIYIECGYVNGDVRLPGGDSGLVEVYYNGWGFICDDEWDTVDSNTLCQILGYSTAITSTTGSFHNSRNYKINFINCDGGESSILDCGYRVYRQNYCSQNEHVNVTCGPANGDIRLTGGSSGQLEVYYDGWGFICDDRWDDVDADVACKILGYDMAIRTTIGVYNSTSNYKLIHIGCRGNESSILDCSYSLYSSNSSSHCSANEHIYTECGPVNGDLRIKGNSSGLLQVYYNGWGFICDNGWDTVDANTTCRILGYDTVTMTSIAKYNASTNYKLFDIRCTGGENSILDCGYRTYSSSSLCSAYEHVYIECGPVNGDIRLTAGFSGLLEVYYNGWGFICDDGWDIVDANTTCKILGYETVITTLTTRYDATTNYKLHHIRCNGSETSILDCGYSLSSYCSAYEHIYIECGPANGELRLTRGDSGLVEVYYNGWGYICDDGWGTVDSNTVCQILGYSAALSTTTRSYHVSTNYRLNFIGCTGNEASILDCGYRVYRPNYCSQYEHVNITCGPVTGDLRLTGGDSGLVEVYYNGWGFICDDGWDSVDSNTVCMILGYEVAASTTTGAYHNSTNYKLRHINCQGNESSILDCAYSTYTPNICSRYEHISISCGPEQLPSPIQPTLVDRDAGSIEIEWQEYLFPVLHYILCVTKSNEIDCNNDFTTSNTSFLIQDLEPGTEYFITVSAFTNHGLSPKSNRTGFTTAPLPPASQPFLVDASACSMEIGWEEYKFLVLYYSLCVTNMNDGSCGTSFRTSNTSLLIQDLEPETEYFITIAAVTEYGASLTNGTRGFTEAPFPQPSQPILVDGRNPDKVTIEWEEYMSTVLRYSLCVTKFNEIGCEKNFTTSNTTFLIEGLQAATNYSVAIIAVTETCQSLASNRLNFTTVLSLPGKPSLASVSKDSAKIEWDEYSVAVSGYRLCYVKLEDNSESCETITSNTFFTIEDLEPDTEYSVTITAITEPNGRLSPSSEGLIFGTPRENKPPTITSPVEGIELIIIDTIMRANFNLTQECTATGFPQPTVTWSGALSMKFVIGNVLSIKPGDLEEIKDINPLRFICNATNSEGSDTKIVKILIKIAISETIDKLINVTDEQANNLTNIITANTNGVNTSAENTTEIQQELEIIAKDFNNLVSKYLITSESVNTDTVINLLDTAQAIISKDSNLEEEEIQDEVDTENNVAPASPVLLTTLNTVENIASNAAQRLEDSENDTNLIYRARTITVIAQNINLPEIDSETSNLIIPKVEKGIMNGIEERIQIPSENFGILSSNNRNLRIATTIVDTMEIRSETKKQNSPRLFSNIVSLVIPSKTDQKIKLAQPIKLTFPVFRGNPNNLQVCSFLDNAYWSDEGLRTDEMNNVTDCYTDHLTSFAVFVTPRDLGPDNRIASIVSYVVVSISFIFLIASLVLFILSGKKFFKVEANIVYFNYCLSLTLAFGLFLFGIETGKFNEILCKIIAFLLHYLWLSVFVWTLCNGILIIYKLTLGIMKQHKVYPYLIVFGWTFPIVIPIITVAVKHDKYVDTTQHCFLTYEDGIIWAFIAPSIAIILVNMVILVISVIRISTTKFGSEKLKEKQVIKTALVSTLILTPLLGIPWIILLLNIFIVNSIVQWVFIIINGLMGIFFFFVITMRNAEVKKLFKMKKGGYSQVSVSTENKSSSMLSKKFKRPVQRDTTDTSSATQTEASKKGEYFALEAMGTSEIQDDDGAVKSPTRYTTPPRLMNLPKPKPKGSRDEPEQETRCDIPVTVKSDQPNIYYSLAPKDVDGEKGSPVYVEIPEETSFSGFEYPSETTEQNTGKSVEVDDKFYESMH